MKKVLVTSWVPPHILEKFSADIEFNCPSKEKAKYSLDEAKSMAGEYDALMLIGCPGPKELIDAAVKAKAVATSGVGYNHIDYEYAGSKGVAVVNTPNAVTHPTAELAMTLILSVSRGIVFFDKRLRANKDTVVPTFGDPLFEFSSTPHGKTLGVVGFGRIGKEVARKCKAALDMNIIYYDVVAAPAEVEKELGAKKVSLEELLKTADYVTLHCPYFKENHHLIDEKAFKLMKPTAYFINAARGPIMDEAALIRALKEGGIKGAGLDVYEYEPKVSEELLGLDNVVLSPHIGTYTYENRCEMVNEALTGLHSLLTGTMPKNVVNLEFFPK